MKALRRYLTFCAVLAAALLASDAGAWPVGNKLLNVSYAATTAIYSDFFAPPPGSSQTTFYAFATTAGTVQIFMIDPDGNQTALTPLLSVNANDQTEIDQVRPLPTAVYAVFTPSTQPGSVRIYAFAAGANVH